MKERYWHIQMFLPDGKGGKQIDSIKMLQEDIPIIGTGDWDDIQCRHFKGEENGLEIGDIIMVREGKKPLALCEIISDCFSDSTLTKKFKNYWFRKVKVLDWAKNDEISSLFSQGTLNILYKSSNTRSWHYINNWYKNIKHKQTMNNFSNLLEKNKNIILTGAPGTGKTYKTAEIAVSLIDGFDKVPNSRKEIMSRYKELINHKQIAFTTFHQSLDYEEFVEGLKPDIDDDGSGKGTFSVKSGIFKTMSQIALKNLENSKKPAEAFFKEKSISELFDFFLDDAMSNKKEFDYDSNKHESGSNKFELLPHNDDNYFYVQIKKNQSLKQQRIVKDGLLFVLLNESKINRPTDISKLFNTRFKYQYTFMFLILDLLRKDLIELTKNSINYKLDEKEDLKKTVLIIDEINRGNISKIFGELITLLEKDKRIGEENEILATLPYSQDSFGIPNNLYIIGTMNTADRSIGHIDYAIRRRFAFVSLKSDKTIIKSYDNFDAGVKEKAENLFDKIKSYISKNINSDLDADDLMIGHSYFLCKTEEDFKIRIEYEIIPLIQEYEKDGIIMVDKCEMNLEFERWLSL